MKKDPLEHLKLSFVCPINWEAMEGNEKARFCEQCQKHVYNLEECGEEEARALIQGQACVRFRRDEKGRVLTKRTVGIAVAVALGAASLSSCASNSPSDTIPITLPATAGVPLLESE